MNTAYISMGSNIEPERNLAQAVGLLTDLCMVVAVSKAYRTPPQGFTEQSDFLNMALQIKTNLSPTTLKKEVLDWIEGELGRTRDPNNKNAPRTIDLDISLWNHNILEYGEKKKIIPDPDIVKFAHVVVPLAEIAPDYVHPQEKVTLKEIAARFDVSNFQSFMLPSHDQI